jgi:hypothetical protein
MLCTLKGEGVLSLRNAQMHGGKLTFLVRYPLQCKFRDFQARD